jgi:hypothetical protein
MVSKEMDVCEACVPHTSISFGYNAKGLSHQVHYTEQMFFSQTKKCPRHFIFFQAWKSFTQIVFISVISVLTEITEISKITGWR